MTLYNLKEKLPTSELPQQDKLKKKNKSIQKFKKIYLTNITRYISNYINSAFDLSFFKGLVYLNIHNLFVCLVTFIITFNNSIIHLCIILIILSFDAISIVILHNCPLTILEKKYLGKSSYDVRDKMFKELNINYDCCHTYEKQIELLINVWSVATCKILIIIFLNCFNIKLCNFNNLYA